MASLAASKEEHKKPEKLDSRQFTVFTDSPNNIKITPRATYPFESAIAHSQLRDLLHFSTDYRYLYYVGKEPRPADQEDSVYYYGKNCLKKVNLATQEKTQVDTPLHRVVTITAKFGFVAAASHSHFVILTEYNDKVIFNSEDIDFERSGQLNGVKFRMTGTDTKNPRLFLFVSCNGNYVPLFEIKKGPKGLEVDQLPRIVIGKNTNNITFGTGKYDSYMMAACDYFNEDDIWFHEDPVGTWTKVKGKKFQKIEEESGYKYSMMGSWIPESPWCSLGTDEGKCAVFNFDNGHKEAEYTHTFSVRSIACCPNPAVPLLVYGDDGNNLHFVEIGSWRHKRIQLSQAQRISGIAWKDDGTTLYIAFTNSLIEYNVQVGFRTLHDMCIEYIAKTHATSKWDLSKLPADLVAKIKEEISWVGSTAL